MPPVVCIVGRGKVGKTTFVEKLIPELKSRGYRVATVKHATHISFDTPGKDSWRHIEAGSEATVVSSAHQTILVRPEKTPPTLDTIAPLFGEDYDIILAEGFKQNNTPKIEVHRREKGPPLENLTKLVAVVTDEPLDSKIRQFGLDDVKAVADLLEEGFIRPHKERISLYVNHTPIVLTSFPKDFVTNVLLAMVSSLKGVEKIKNLALFMKRRD